MHCSICSHKISYLPIGRYPRFWVMSSSCIQRHNLHVFKLQTRLRIFLLGTFFIGITSLSFSFFLCSFFFLIDLIFFFLKSTFRFTEDSNGKYRDFPRTPSSRTHSLPHYQHPTQEWCLCDHPSTCIDTPLSSKVHS